MTPEQSIQPLNVAAATLLVQLMFMLLLSITVSIYHSQRSTPFSVVTLDPLVLPSKQLRRSPTLFVALGSLLVLLLSDDLYSIWSPLFQGVGINTISSTTAISIVFVVDLGLVAYLVWNSGGSRSSPFLSSLFTLPALAIFLRLPPSMFFTYAAIASVIYLVLLVPSFDRAQPGQSAAAFINIACLLLSMVTGYITRPVPITELKPVPQNAQSAIIPQPK